MNRVNAYYYEREEHNTNGVAFAFAHLKSVDAKVGIKLKV